MVKLYYYKLWATCYSLFKQLNFFTSLEKSETFCMGTYLFYSCKPYMVIFKVETICFHAVKVAATKETEMKITILKYVLK